MRTSRFQIIAFIIIMPAVPLVITVDSVFASGYHSGLHTASFFYPYDETDQHPMIREVPNEQPALKSKTRARLYSVAAITLPLAAARLNARGYRLSEQSGTSIVLITSGIIVGPSAGSIYADDWMLARRSIIVRSASAAVLSAGYLLRRNELSESLGSVFMLSGGVFLAGHLLYDIIFLSAHSVDFYNARVRLEAGVSLLNTIPQDWGMWSGSGRNSEANRFPGLDLRLHF